MPTYKDKAALSSVLNDLSKFPPLVFAGEASQVNAGSGNAAGQAAFNALRLIVTVGWAIYPLGYAVGYFGGGIDTSSLNLIYNVADFVNKIAFGMVIYVAAVSDSNK